MLMNRRAAGLALGFISASMATISAQAALLNPFDTELSPDLHAFASCNFVVNAVTPNHADCVHTQTVENPVTLVSVSGDSTAISDLATGKLGARATAHAYRFGVENLKAGGISDARFYDTIRVLGGYTGPVEVRMTVSGDMLPSLVVSPVTGNMVASLYAFDTQADPLGQVNLFVDQYTSGEPFISSEFIGGLPGTITTNADGLGDFPTSRVEATLTMQFFVSPAAPEFTFGASLFISSVLGPFIGLSPDVQTDDLDFGTADGDGAQLSLVLPPGVAWTSTSGVFLPEPASTPLLAIGCLGLARLASRRATHRDGATTCSRSETTIPIT